MLSDLRQLNPVAHAVFSCIQAVYKVGSLCVFNVNDITYFFWQHLKTQEETHEAMKGLANSIQVLAGQLNRLKGVPTSDQLCCTIREFPVIMEEVVNFIQRWLKSQMCMC